MHRVVIGVRGGVAEVLENSGPVDVVIKDYDSQPDITNIVNVVRDACNMHRDIDDVSSSDGETFTITIDGFDYRVSVEEVVE
jgi:hypothetical protein